MICIYFVSISLIQASKCPVSIPSSSFNTKESCSFSEYSTTFAYRVVDGQISNSIYYCYDLFTPSVSTGFGLSKINMNGSQAWITSFPLSPIMKSLSIDSSEKNLYLGVFENPLVVLRFSTTNGSIVSQQIFTIKFIIEEIGSISDFATPLYSINVLSAGVDEISTGGTMTIGSVNSQSFTEGTYRNQTVTYKLI